MQWTVVSQHVCLLLPQGTENIEPFVGFVIVLTVMSVLLLPRGTENIEPFVGFVIVLTLMSVLLLSLGRSKDQSRQGV